MPLKSKRKKRLTVIFLGIILAILFYSLTVLIGFIITSQIDQNRDEINTSSETEQTTNENDVGSGFMYVLAFLLIVIAVILYRYRVGEDLTLTVFSKLKNKAKKISKINGQKKERNRNFIEIDPEKYEEKELIENIYSRN